MGGECGCQPLRVRGTSLADQSALNLARSSCHPITANELNEAMAIFINHWRTIHDDICNTNFHDRLGI